MKTVCGVLLLAGMVLAAPDFREYVSGETSSEEAGDLNEAGSTSTTCPCGWTDKGRIVGGKATRTHEFPLQVAILEGGPRTIWCGGSILTPHVILSAAHCTYPKRGQPLLIVAGTSNINGALAGSVGQVVEVAKTIEHENYNPQTLENDVALLVLAKPLRFSQHVGPVCMPTAPHKLVGQNIKVIGWGMTVNRKASSVANDLLKVNLRVMDLQSCADMFPFQPIDPADNKQICTFRRSKDSCSGDSGGPLLSLDSTTNRYTQVGLVSYGRSCAKSSPALNTDVFHYLPWIKKNLADVDQAGQLCHKV